MLFLFIAGAMAACSKDNGPNDGPDRNKTTPISYENLPRESRNFIEANYPELKITELEKDKNGYEVGLSNDKDLIFDKDGKFLRVDD